MSKRVVITGGAGFVGSFTIDLLLEKGVEVVILNSVEPQVHDDPPRWPTYLDPRAERIVGAIEDEGCLRRALQGADAILHLGAVVGVGQSMHEIKRYVVRNTAATAALLQVVASEFRDQIRKIVVASSMSIYGEGAYACDTCGVVYPDLRPDRQLAARNWEMQCPTCGADVRSLATPEEKSLRPTSIYAITKRDQGELSLVIGRAYGIPTIALRYFNIYGPRQALSNPYTGVGAIFSSRLLNGKPRLVFEDGRQARDFVHVRDVARANIMLALEAGERAHYQAINIGTGKPNSILALADHLARTLEISLEPEILNQFRKGDIRHCFADTARARNLLDFEARIPLAQGVGDLADWVA